MKSIDEIRTIHVVPYSHHDHAWTNTRQWHIWRYIEGFCLALDRMNEHDGYTLEIDNVLHSLEVFEKYCPERVEEFKSRVREGRIGVSNGGMALARPADFDGELLIRNGAAGRRAFMERFGLEDIPVYWNADTACGTSQMPQLLRLMGHRYYRFQRPEATLDRMSFPRQFIWRGLDGSEVTVVRGVYGGCMVNRWAQAGDDWTQKRNTFIQEELSEKLVGESSDQMLMHIGQDDCLPMLDISDKPYPFDELMRAWNGHEASRMIYSTQKQFFESLPLNQLPVWEGPIDECDLAFNAAVRTDRSLRTMRLKCERGLLDCERLDAIAQSLGAPGQRVVIDDMWLRLFRFSGHAMQHLLDHDYDEIRDGAQATVALVEELKRNLADDIAQRAHQIERVGHVVINPTLSEGDVLVDMNLTTPHHIDGLKLIDDRGRELAYQIYDVLKGDKPYVGQYNEVRAVVKVNVPPMGWRSLGVVCDGRALPEPERAELSEGHIIDNGLMRVTFNHGLVTHIETAEGAIISDAPLTALRFCETRSTGDWTHYWKPLRTHDFVPERATLAENGPLRWKVVTQGRVASSPAALTISIERASRVISCALTIDNREGEGYYSLSWPCEAEPDLIAGIPFGQEARHPERQPYAPIDDEASPLLWERGWPYAFYANGFVSGRAGAGRLILLQGNLSTLMRAEPGAHEVTAHMFRSIDLDQMTVPWMKHMNEDMDGRGRGHFSFAFAVAERDHDPALIQALVERQRHPPICAVRYALGQGCAPAAGSLAGIISGHVELSAAYREGEALILRVFETAGRDEEVILSIPREYTHALSVDFNGDALREPVAIDTGRVSFHVRAYEIRTLKLEKTE